MKNPRLAELLSELHAEVNHLGTLDAASQSKIEAMFQQIESQVNQTERDSSDTREQLHETIIHFEVTHPTLTHVLNQISSMLSSMGI